MDNIQFYVAVTRGRYKFWPVSVYIITKNCESTLHATLASVADFAEIILVDSEPAHDRHHHHVKLHWAII